MTNAVSLASTTISTSVLGLGFWFLAARAFSSSQVGFASAALSAMALVSTISSLGLGTYAMGEAQRSVSRRAARVTTVIVASAIASVPLSLGYVLCAPHISTNLNPLIRDPWTTAAFVIGAVATSVATVLDHALIGALKGGTQLARNMCFGIFKLLFVLVTVAVFSRRDGTLLLEAWAGSLTLSLGALAVAKSQWTRSLLRHIRPAEISAVFQEIARAVFGHQLLNVGLKVPLLALPVLVIAVLSAQASAQFYIAWQVAGALFVLPGSLATMLYAVGAEDKHALAQRLKFTLGLSTIVTVVFGMLLVGASRSILSLFGAEYASEARTTLVILAAASIPTMIKNHYVAVSRITGKLRTAMPIIYAGALIEILAAFAGAKHSGLAGFAGGWVGALALECVLMAPLIIRSMRT